jgi:LuxR family maltose regulon positive regulatory protein
MARPVIATKLYVPRPRAGLVARPRLGERLRQGADARLVLVSAPAGFGKTTLLADGLAGDGLPVAWLSLGPEDREPSAFWTGVVTALRTAAPDVGSTALELAAATPLPTEHLLAALLNDLAATQGELWLVLDDYHLVDSPDVGDGVAFFLDRLPRQVHVVLATRADPGLPLSRWRVRGELVEIRAADLRFTADEVGAYLSALDLAPADVTALTDRTEGWIAALQLAALSLRGRADAGGFIARFAGDDRYIVDYLVEEVLARQPEPVRDFLLRTSVLDRLTGPLCDAVTGGDTGPGSGTETLVALERANLFVVPLDDRREWFRYHHLFADVLRARVLAEHADLVPGLHQRASRWYEDHDLVADAVGHALAARDVDRAAYLMELAAPAIRRDRREAVLHDWLRALPDDVLGRSPVLSVLQGHLLMVAGDLDAAASRLDDAERALASEKDGRWADTEELRTLPATIAIYRASLAQARGDAAGTTEHARHALDLAGPADHLARAGAAGFLGLAAWARGDVASARETFGAAVASMHAAGAIVDELGSTVSLADMWLAAGRPSEARRCYEHALATADEHGDAVAGAAADVHVGIGELDLEAGDLDGARRHLDTAAALHPRAPRTQRHHRWSVAMGLLTAAAGDPRRGVGFLDEAERRHQPGFVPEVRPLAALRARLWLAHGAVDQAAGWAREHGVSTQDDVGYLREYEHLTVVRLDIARHRVDDACLLLDRLHDAAESSGRDGSLFEIRVLQALARHARGQRTHAVETLARAWARAPEPDAYVRLFLDEGEPMLALLREATRHATAGGHARRLLGAAPGRRVGVVDALSERELQVLRLLDSELSGPQIARELFVSHNTLRTHTKHIFTKLGVTSRRAAVLRARERGLM